MYRNTNNIVPYCAHVESSKVSGYLLKWLYIYEINRNSYVTGVWFPWKLAVPWLKQSVACLSGQRPGLDPKSACAEFVVDRVAVGEAFFQIFWFLPISAIPSTVHTTISCIYHRCYIILTINNMVTFSASLLLCPHKFPRHIIIV
jgi:hypothetical protein